MRTSGAGVVVVVVVGIWILILTAFAKLMRPLIPDAMAEEFVEFFDETPPPLPNPPSPFEEAQSIPPAAGRRRYRRPVPPPSRREARDRPVCVTKSRATPTTPASYGTYPCLTSPPASRTLRHNAPREFGCGAAWQAARRLCKGATGGAGTARL